jgi:lactoylglutathione lyase
MLIAIHHISLSVSNLDQSIEFYKELGFEVETKRYNVTQDYFRKVIGYPNAIVHTAFLSSPGEVRLELMNYITPKGVQLDLSTPNVGSAHICFIVDNIFLEYGRLKQLGFKFKSQVIPIEQGPNEGGYAVYFLDPDGYTMELLQVPK